MPLLALTFSCLMLSQTGGLSASLDRAPSRKAEWKQLIGSLPREQRGAGEYLLTHMPPDDLSTLKTGYVRDMIKLAFEGRKGTKWGAKIPQDIFYDAVVPYASVTEPRESMREEFLKKYLAIVAGTKTPGEAALAINKVLFTDYKVTYNTRRLRTDQSAKESIRQGMATCTGLSIMLVDALRAVGVPSRLAGISSWPGRGGNHTWVEVWDAGKWHFVGAAEPDEAGLNQAWFGAEAGGAIENDPERAIWAVTYRDNGGRFPIVWNKRATVFADNVTSRYRINAVKKPRLMIEVMKDGVRVVADVEVFDASGKPIHKGKSLDPQADINLHLSFDVTQGQTYRVKATYAGVTEEREVKTETLDTTVRLSLGGSDELFAEAITEDKPFTEANALKVWQAFKDAPDPKMKADFDASKVSTFNRTSPYKWRKVGEKPKDGWGLVIAMHGGGGAPKRVNDGQWEGMFTGYYADQPQVPGYIYLALRAPNDEWNGVYDDAIVPLIERLILQLVKYGEVDPNYVYACGASHGGYGGFVIAPKAPHRFAAVHAAASAPTDGETIGENLRNLRFTWAVGETDTAYGRKERCDTFAVNWEGWKAKFGGFDGAYEMIKGQGHQIGNIERDRITKLRPHSRNAWPKRVLWTQTDDVIKRFYWLESVKPAEKGNIDAEVKGNTITLTTENQGEVALWLSSQLLDLSKPVIVIRDGVKKEYKVKPSLEVYAKGIEQTGDASLSAPVRLVIPAN